MPLADIPEHVQKAFIAAEDKRFHQHKGIDERGVIRAFVGNLAQPGRPQGGSTITQQVAKNLLVGDDVTYERKMREMIVASRLERTLTKPEILEIYLNSIYLGRASWGVEMAAQSYFGKPAKALTLEEGALLAGLTKGPNYYNPDRQPERAQERFAYVLSRIGEDGVIPADRMKQAFGARPQLIALDRVRRDGGFHFVDYLDREAKTLGGVESLTAASYTVRSTVNPALQRATETALQEGLARYELNTGRMSFHGAEANLGEAIGRIQAAGPSAVGKPAWRQALENARLPLYDVRWPAAVDHGEDQGEGRRRGHPRRLEGRARAAADGLDPRHPARAQAARRRACARRRGGRRQGQGQGRHAGARRAARAPARAGGGGRPREQDGPHPGHGRRLLVSPEPAQPRDPGASPAGLRLQAARLPRRARARPAAEHARLGYARDPAAGRRVRRRGRRITGRPRTTTALPPASSPCGARSRIRRTSSRRGCSTAASTTIRSAACSGSASSPWRRSSTSNACSHYPFVLGAQPVRLIDLAAFYAAIANEGVRPSPYSVEMIEQGAQTVYCAGGEAAGHDRLGRPGRVLPDEDDPAGRPAARHGAFDPPPRPLRRRQDRHQRQRERRLVRRLHQRGQHRGVGRHDNADKRRTLGRGQTGGKVAVPIFESIVEAAWTHHAPKTALSPPSLEAQRQLVAMPIDLRTGDQVAEGAPGAFTEHFRRGRFGQVADTQFRLVPREEAYAFHHPDPRGDGEAAGGWFDDVYRGLFAEAPRRRDPRAEAPAWRGPSWVRPWWEEEDERPRRRPRRVDPDYSVGLPDLLRSEAVILRVGLCLAVLGLSLPSRASAEFRLEEVPSVAAAPLPAAKTIAFSDAAGDSLADPATGLLRFEDWAKAKPLHKGALSLYPAYAEPTITVTAHGISKPYKEKLHMYVAEARFVVPRPSGAIDLARYASLEFLEKADPSIKHRLIAAADALPYTDPESAHNRHPDRRWCEAAGRVICIESRYHLEGRLPVGIRLANKLEEGGKKISEYVEFQSELRVLTEIERAGLGRLTGLDTPVSGALEQSIFHVNQMMQFGKFLAVLQRHPADANRTVVSIFMALGIETDVLEKKKEYENVPVLRNMVPAQVLMGKSSFNTGSSISAGLPDYARNRIKAVAAILERE